MWRFGIWLLFCYLSVLMCCPCGAWQNHEPGAQRNRVNNSDSSQQGDNDKTLLNPLDNEVEVCAYRIVERAEEGQLCYRHTWVDFTCSSSTCRQVRAPGGHLVANLLSNGTVLLQWTFLNSQAHLTEPSAAGLPKRPGVGHGGFRMSCFWNGSYTQFECATVRFARSCTDYLLSELHENVPYRICLRPEVWDGPNECVEFSVIPAGMQDIVIAMMTVGGAICVMLVIICLLVAYITENIMSSSVQHTLAVQHSLRSHNTYL